MQYASRIERLEDTSILDILDITETPDMISFSGGFPSPETYPIEDIKDSFIKVLETQGKEAFSYSATSGYRPLREEVAKRMRGKLHTNHKTEEVIITSGSQQGLDMSAMLFMNKDDVVLFETPSYLGAVSALRAHEATLVALPTDKEGLVLSSLKEALNHYGDRVKMIYVNPDFQNPTGRSWSEERRIAFMDLVSGYDVPVVEDGAYAELTFTGKVAKPLAAYDKKGQVIYLGTFSKIFCPGLRVAWLCAPENIMEKYLILKSAADLSSSAISQMQMAYYLKNYSLDAHIAGISALYRERRDVMAEAMAEEFPKEALYLIPDGGLFIWVELPEDLSSKELLKRALKEKVAFVPGTAFYPGATKTNEFRLNFSNMAPEETRKGIKILGKLIKEYMEECR